MAGFKAELPNDLIKMFEEIGKEAPDMLGHMTKAGAEVVYKNVLGNMRKVFKSTKSLEKGLKITRVYRNSRDEVATKIGFYGYDKEKTTKKYPNGVPIPLIASAREYGTSSGEAKKPFFRTSFKKREITDAMLREQEKYLPKE